MLRSVSASQYLDAIRMAERFILHVECLFGCIDDLENFFITRGVKGKSTSNPLVFNLVLNLIFSGMSHVREARMLCRKTVDLFTLLSRSSSQQSSTSSQPSNGQGPSSQVQTQEQRVGMTQELLALVTGLAHYLKILIRIALTGGLKLGREHSDGTTPAPEMQPLNSEKRMLMTTPAWSLCCRNWRCLLEGVVLASRD